MSPSFPAAKTVVVSGAAGQISYSLLFNIARGNVLGPDQPVDLVLFDIPPMRKALDGIMMELDDGAYPLLHSRRASTDAADAMVGASVVLLLGGFPRRPGMLRGDLLAKNAPIFGGAGRAIEKHARTDVKVLVVANPANTNCLLARQAAPSLPDSAFTALTRLDHNRGNAMLAKHLECKISEVPTGLAIWGNHSQTQFACLEHVNAGGHFAPGSAGAAWARDSFLPAVQKRGAAVLDARKASSAASAAQAISDHVRTWLVDGTRPGEWTSMAVPSDGSYGIAKGLIFSFPVQVAPGSGEAKIVQGLALSAFAKQQLQATQNELMEERAIAAKL